MTKIKRILIIDDNEIDAYITNRVIKEYNGNIKTKIIYQPIEALQYLKTILDFERSEKSSFVPQLILLDLNMPQLDGFQLLDELMLSQHFANNPIPIYMLSSSCSSLDIEKSLEKVLCRGFISKHIDKSKLGNIIAYEQSSEKDKTGLVNSGKKVI
ncbi:MAG: response regulator [Croceitalea sp.]|nr:response regulator [Croceitalea sp.]MBT8237228.1 response regulator [Croceitalea sp.]NNC34917.1 response regulator [Croceitalea sp.]NNL08846.1 response regulator [Croceitalea sp.]NNM18161.1 response regulator [Croceitalea sp.]